MEKKFKGFGSACLHAGGLHDTYHSHLTPIYTSSTYSFENSEQAVRLFTGEADGYVYSRFGSPTITEAEQRLKALETFGLEKAELETEALLFASGMGAISTLMLASLEKGDKILSHYSLYGGTQELIDKVLPGLGVQTLLTDMKDVAAVRDILQKESGIRLMYLETPANPTLQCVPIKVLCELGHEFGCRVVVDNTFATPFLQQPLALGADVVIHSTTKFLNGHGTALGGVLVGRDKSWMLTRVRKFQRLLGASASAFDVYQLINGLKTLALRMERQVENARQLADLLSRHKSVLKVNYLGLSTHPDYEIAQSQMKSPGAMLSFEVCGGKANALKLLDKLQLATHAVSLGTCDTLISHPASTTHVGVAPELRLRSGIGDGLLRVSVGIENAEDILADFSQALDQVSDMQMV